MAETKNIAVLFDFDGVVVDTETQYSVFWHKMGVDYLGMEDLESRVKGQTLMYIYDTFFPGMTKEREDITVGLDRTGYVIRFCSRGGGIYCRSSP